MAENQLPKQSNCLPGPAYFFLGQLPVFPDAYLPANFTICTMPPN
jgi:hypothetical protein